MFYLKLTTGIRRGELVALLWDDLDLEAQTLAISKSAGRINGEVKVTQPNKAKTRGRVKRYESMKDLSLSAKTIRGLHAMLRQCLDQAVQERLILYNPAAGCKLPPKEKKEMHTLPAEKISAYLAAAEEHGVLPMFYLELTTGIRRDEAV